MKYFFIICSLFISQVSNAQLNCDQWVRAVNSDQKNMLMAVTFSDDALRLDVRQVYSLKIENYVSWKGEQKECLANVLHRADLVIQSIEPSGDLCTHALTLHRFDNFLTTPTLTDYKIRDLLKTCEPLSQDQLQFVRACLATTCANVGNARTFPDYSDNCACKSVEAMIQFDDESMNYNNFFDPESVFEKPEGVGTPFE